MKKMACKMAVKDAIDRVFKVITEEFKKWEVVGLCDPDTIDEGMKTVLAKILGVKDNPVSCEILLSQPVTERICRDFYEQRRWVMCRAHQILKEEHEKGEIADLGEAIEKAWDELREKCLKMGYYI